MVVAVLMASALTLQVGAQPQSNKSQAPEPLRIGVVGLVHPHAEALFDILKRNDVQVVGVSESAQEVVAQYVKKGLDPGLLYRDEAEMIEKTHPQAVLIYTNTYDHVKAVQIAARYGVHVAMEKPLAVSTVDAHAIARAAHTGNIYVLVNFTPTWYPNTTAAYALLHDKSIGDARKIVVRDGHSGPKPLTGSLGWLFDPKLNGGGALFDFGCYGANLVTWLMDGKRPTSVTAVTQTIRPETYPLVDDDATIILTYPKASAVLQPSWNYPFNQKQMDVYGATGYAMTVRDNALRVRRAGQQQDEIIPSPPLTPPQDDFLHYLKAVVVDGVKPSGPSSLEINIVATEILDAARRSAKTRRRIDLSAN